MTTDLFYVPPTEELRYLPECPRRMRNFPYSDPFLGWVAIQHSADDQTGSFNMLNLRTFENTTHRLPGRPGFFAETTQSGVILIPLDRRLVLYDILRKRIQDPGWVATTDERCIINDGLPVPGGVIFGTKHLSFSEPIAEIYYFDSASHKITTLAGGQVCSNGKHLYFEDGTTWLADICSATKQVSRYKVDLAAGEIRRDGVIADFTSGEVFPDGMRATPDGRGLVIAFFDPRMSFSGFVRQYNLKTGEMEREWELEGAPRVTCPEIARINGKVRLVATTATEGMPPEIRKQAPCSGVMFIGETPWDEEPPPPPLVAVDIPIPI